MCSLSQHRLVLTVAFLAIIGQSHCNERSYRMCLPDERLPYHEDPHDYFKDQAERVGPPVLRLYWSRGRDKIDCLRQVRDGVADVTVADAALLHVAAMHFNGNLSVIGTIHTEGMEDEEFATKTVAVIRDTQSGMSNLNVIRHKGVCMDAMQPRATWHAPVSVLFRELNDKLKIYPECSGSRSTLEMEASVVKKFFGSVCTVNIDKHKNPPSYASCPQCMESTCNAPSYWNDPLDCLMESAGKVAFTTLQNVRQFVENNGTELHHWTFQDNLEGETHSLQFLCPDDTLQPLNEKDPCVWGTEPWGALLARNDVKKSEMMDIQDHVGIACDSHLICLMHPPLGFRPEHSPVRVRVPVSPLQHISQDPSYLLTYERPDCKTSVRFCVGQSRELAKCEDLRAAAIALHIRPAIECVVASEDVTCVDKLGNGEADFAVLEALDFYDFEKAYNLEPVMSAPQLAVGQITSLALAVVPEKSQIRTLEDLRGNSSCHAGFRSNAGWYFPLHRLIHAEGGGSFRATECQDTMWAAHFFKDSCVPGLQAPSQDPHKVHPSVLCEKCPEWRVGRAPLCGTWLRNPSVLDRVTLRCLVETGGVAFVTGDAVFWQSKLTWKDQWDYEVDRRIRGIPDGYGDFPNMLSTEEYLLLCPDSRTQPLSQLPGDCHWGQIPWPQLVTTARQSEQVRLDLTRVIKEVNMHMGGNVTGAIFYLFGPFNGEPNLLFNDFTSNLEPAGKSQGDVWDSFVEIQETFDRCFEKPPPNSGKASHVVPWWPVILNLFSVVVIIMNVLE